MHTIYLLLLIIVFNEVICRDCSESEVRYCSYGSNNIITLFQDKICEATNTDNGEILRCDYVGIDWNRDYEFMKSKCKNLCDINDSHHKFKHNRNFITCECYHY